MKSIFHKKSPKSDSPVPKKSGDYILEGITGVALGKVYVISSEPTSINDRFSIVKKGDYTLAKSLTENELYISGEFIHEAILEPGDVIVTLNSEYRFRFKSANEEIVERRKQWAVRLGMLGLLLFLFLPVVAPRYTPWPAVFDQAQVQQAIEAASSAFQETAPREDLAFGENPPPSTPEAPVDSSINANKITDPARVSQAIAQARMRYEIAKDYAQQGDLFAGHLFWAIQELKEASRTLSNIEPAPDMLAQVNKEIQQYENVLDAHLKHLHVRALIAQQLGNNDQYIKLVKEIRYVSQSQGSSAFEWATKALKNAAN